MTRPISLLCLESDAAEAEAWLGYADILGWTATMTATADESSELAARRAFDLLVVDQDLPGGAGRMMVEDIRAGSGPNASTPVLFSSMMFGEGDDTAQVTQKPLLFSTFKGHVLRLTSP